MHLRNDLMLWFGLHIIFAANPLDTRQPLSAVTHYIVDIGKIDFVAIWVTHTAVDGLVVWATGSKFSKQILTPSDAVRICTQNTALCVCALVGVQTAVVPGGTICGLEIRD